MGTSSEKLSLVIPIYNEIGHLEEFLKQVDAIDLGVQKELVFVDDCSKDGSRDLLTSFKFQSEHQILLQEYNQGKGAALKRGFDAARGTIIVVQDADFEYDMRDIPTLVQPVLENRADVVYGSRFRKNGSQVHRTFHYLVNRFLTLLSNMFSGLYLSDMETCYKIFRSEIIKNIVLECNRFGFEPEVTAKLARLKVRIQEFPISYFPRNYLEGKKINWKDGVAALFHIVRYNFFRTPEQMFRPTMPARYKLSGRQWL